MLPPSTVLAWLMSQQHAAAASRFEAMALSGHTGRPPSGHITTSHTGAAPTTFESPLSTTSHQRHLNRLYRPCHRQRRLNRLYRPRHLLSLHCQHRPHSLHQLHSPRH
ncbi:hypothetical protein BGW80DRAFT_1397065, partial [Lactifluus volemus]